MFASVPSDEGAKVADIPFEIENGATGTDEEQGKEHVKEQASKQNDVPGMRGVRFASAFMVIFWICCIVLASVHLDLGVKCSVSDNIVMTSPLLEECVRQTAVFRITAVVAILLSVQAVLCIFFVNAANVGLWDDWWLVVKFPLFALGSFGLLFPKEPLTFFSDAGFAWVARFGAFAFIIFQSLVFLDWAYQFNESFVSKALEKSGGSTVAASLQRTADGLTANATKTNIRLICLLVFAAANLSVFFIVMGLLYKSYGSAECKDNVTVITISLISVVVATLCQIFNTSGSGSVTTSGVLSLYVAYTTYSGVTLNPDIACNPSLANDYGLGPMVLGLIMSFLSVIYITFIAARKIATLIATGPLPLTGLLGVIVGYKSSADYGYMGKLDFDNTNMKIMVVNLSFVYLLVTFYVSMVMTSWGTFTGFESIGGSTNGLAEIASSVSASSVSMYMNAFGGWVAVALYILGLCIPKWSDCLPASIWNLRMK